jgi:hypothetical protein
MPRPQYSLKAILVIMAVLAVPLGLAATWELTEMAIALAITPSFVGGSIGYLIAGEKGALVGVTAGVAGVFLGLLLAAVWMYATGTTIHIPAY